MKYRDFGRTGIKVSALGFGAMRLPTVGEDEAVRVDVEKSLPVLERALDLGVNYIDSAWGYLNQTSEEIVGRAVAGRDRSSLYISTKNPLDADVDVKEWRGRLDIQLKRLDAGYIDFYHFHGLQWREFKGRAVPEGHLKELHRARDEGLIRHISFSSHDSPANIIKLIDTGEFSSMLVQYNVIHRHNAVAIEHAREKGMGVTIMGPVGGGRIGFMSTMKPQEGRTVPGLCLRYVLSNPNVSVALSGMENVAMVEENAATAEDDGPLSPVEAADLDTMLEQVKDLEDLYCTGCGYCMPCPSGVNIPTNFLLLNYLKFYDFDEDMVQAYHRGLKPAGRSADFCSECEECIPKCPQNINIPERLKEVEIEFQKALEKLESAGS